MVVVDYSISERYCRAKYMQEVVQKQQQILADDADADVAVSSNFCPRLRPALTLLLRHKVGPLQQQVHLSDFQSSTWSPLPIGGPSSNAKHPRYDRFVLALPYFCEDLSTTPSRINLVRWAIITQCGRPDRAPEVILLGVDDLAVDSAYGDASLQRPHSNQRSQQEHIIRRVQSHKIVQERYWQQYVASDVFRLPCLTKWEKINKDNSSVMQYCLLADQLYECYCQFQHYKLKMSLKLVSLVQSAQHLIEAYTQYKQLVKLSKSTEESVGNLTSDLTTAMSIELLVELEDSLIAKEYEDRRKQRISSGLIQMRVIISLQPIELAMTSPLSNDFANQNLYNGMLNLAVVNTVFLPPVTPGSNNKNTSKLLKNKYDVKFVNPYLNNSTHQQDMIASMLETASESCLDSRIIDFVTYVQRVQNIAVELFNSKMNDSNQEKLTSENNDSASNCPVLESLFKTFCDSPSNGNCLLDYQINNNNTGNKKASFIRFLLVDADVSTESTQLKYILTIEFNNEDLNNCLSYKGNTDTAKMCVPTVALRSVYDDENCKNYLNIDIEDLITDHKQNHVVHDEFAKIIKIATNNAIKKLRHNVLTPVLTRYNKVWSPIDPYFIRSSQKPPSYPLP